MGEWRRVVEWPVCGERASGEELGRRRNRLRLDRRACRKVERGCRTGWIRGEEKENSLRKAARATGGRSGMDWREERKRRYAMLGRGLGRRASRSGQSQMQRQRQVASRWHQAAAAAGQWWAAVGAPEKNTAEQQPPKKQRGHSRHRRAGAVCRRGWGHLWGVEPATAATL